MHTILACAEPAGVGTGGGGISVQTDNTAGEIDNFSSPTFKSLSMWYPRVKSSILDLIVAGTFEASDLPKLQSHSTGAQEQGRTVLWYTNGGFAAPETSPDDLLELGLSCSYLKAFPSIMPLLDVWSIYTGVCALCDPTGGGVAAVFSIYTTLLLQFATQYEWNTVLLYHYKFTTLRMAENFHLTRWKNPNLTLVSTCLVQYPLSTAAALSAKKCALADQLTSLVQPAAPSPSPSQLLAPLRLPHPVI
ncbi:hypothetical protein B0H17DRAFT_1200759 [Mycena rosella]|uniref:Uncharacterized protein n=1 Tax=Mycena rosella TaxID=1033263 RepID=A0AAD7DIT7_MYCRO|nr:hypothetical protein B0H17DRAFT_1200759 [Mycena rosella]